MNNDEQIHVCEYEDTESYQVTEMFINNREQILHQLLEGSKKENTGESHDTR